MRAIIRSLIAAWHFVMRGYELRMIKRAQRSRQRQPKAPIPFVILEGEGS